MKTRLVNGANFAAVHKLHKGVGVHKQNNVGPLPTMGDF